MNCFKVCIKAQNPEALLPNNCLSKLFDGGYLVIMRVLASNASEVFYRLSRGMVDACFY